jgi:hypothetical protein
MPTKDERREVVKNLYPVKSQKEIAEELDVHRNTVSADVQALRMENLLARKTDTAIDWQAQMAEVLVELDQFKKLASGLEDRHRIRLGLQIMDRWIKLISLGTPQMLLVGTKNIEDMDSDKILWTLFEPLNQENQRKVMQLMLDLKAEQDNMPKVKIPSMPETQEQFSERMRRRYPDQFLPAGEPPAKTLVEGVVISPSGEAMRLGHGDGKEKR